MTTPNHLIGYLEASSNEDTGTLTLPTDQHATALAIARGAISLDLYDDLGTIKAMLSGEPVDPVEFETALANLVSNDPADIIATAREFGENEKRESQRMKSYCFGR